MVIVLRYLTMMMMVIGDDTIISKIYTVAKVMPRYIYGLTWSSCDRLLTFYMNYSYLIPNTV